MSNENPYTTLLITIEGDKVAARLKGVDEDPSKYTSLSLTSDRLELKVLDLCRRLIDENKIHSREDFKLVGRLLHKVLFTDKVNESFTLVFGSANPNAEHRLRVELEFKRQDQLGLSKLPWEYLVYRDGKTGNWLFVSTVAELVLTRYLQPKAGAKQVVVGLDQNTINVLLVFSNPKGTLPDLEPTYKAVQHQLEDFKNKLLKQNITVNVDVIEGPVTWNSFQAKIREVGCRPHILHLIAHGQFEGTKENRSGSIAFLSRTDTEPPPFEWHPDSSFVNVFANANKLPRFVFLHMCEGGAFDKQEEGSSAGVALRLAEEGVPAVVAMQHNIDIDMATAFSGEFYSLLEAGNTIDEAVQLSRSKIEQTNADDRAFGTPVLFLSTSSEDILPKIQKKKGEGSGIISPSKTLGLVEYDEYLFPFIQEANNNKWLSDETADELDKQFKSLFNAPGTQWLDTVEKLYSRYTILEKKQRDLCKNIMIKIKELMQES